MLDVMTTGPEERNRLISFAKQDYDAKITDAAEHVKIQVSIADRALQSLMVANGGSLMALFNFGASAHQMRFDDQR